jgi:NAD+ kinase
MKIAIYGQFSNRDTIDVLKVVMLLMEPLNFEVSLENELYQNTQELHAGNPKVSAFHSYEDIDSKCNLFISIGGDGSMLRAMTFIRDLGIPIVGFNTGRLGFLATLQKEDVKNSLSEIIKGNYRIEERALLTVKTTPSYKEIEAMPLALNEVSVGRKNTTSMINIDTHLDDEYLNNYWADGLIIATPTGSTGYSLSSGGPVMAPSSEALVITPIAPHNLNARPLVIPNHTSIKLRVIGREEDHLLSLDSRIITVAMDTEITIKKAPFTLKMAQLNDERFFKTLRKKLLWGEDTRN